MNVILGMGEDVGQYIWYGVAAVGFLIVFAMMLAFLAFGKLWLKARFSGAPVSFFSLFGMLVEVWHLPAWVFVASDVEE